jgi:Fe-S oxidoreductase
MVDGRRGAPEARACTIPTPEPETDGTFQRLGLEVEMLDSVCCGLAGSFGFEASRYDLSVRIAGERLLPQLAETPPDALLVADGFSCKTQIEALSDHRPMHVVEAIAEGVRARTQMVR